MSKEIYLRSDRIQRGRCLDTGSRKPPRRLSALVSLSDLSREGSGSESADYMIMIREHFGDACGWEREAS